MRETDCCLSVFHPEPEEEGGGFVVEELCNNSFHSEEAKSASVSEVVGGFPRTKYVLTMARGLLYSAVNYR